MEGYAPDAVYHDEIGSCFAGGVCAPLCEKLFGVALDDLASCKIIARDPSGARVRGVLADDGGADVDSTDPAPPDDGCDDGSCPRRIHRPTTHRPTIHPMREPRSGEDDS
jgi:hypothetical protein